MNNPSLLFALVNHPDNDTARRQTQVSDRPPHERRLRFDDEVAPQEVARRDVGQLT